MIHEENEHQGPKQKISRIGSCDRLLDSLARRAVWVQLQQVGLPVAFEHREGYVHKYLKRQVRVAAAGRTSAATGASGWKPRTKIVRANFAEGIGKHWSESPLEKNSLRSPSAQ